MMGQSGWLKRLFSPDRRREERRHLPGLVAHYWDGSAPRARDVLDISPTGSYLQTEERWYPGTVFRVTLQCKQPGTDSLNLDSPDSADASAVSLVSAPGDAVPNRQEAQSLRVLAEMVRHGANGVGVRFIFPEDANPQVLRKFPDCRTDRKTLMKFLKRAEGDHSAVTFSLD